MRTPSCGSLSPISPSTGDAPGYRSAKALRPGRKRKLVSVICEEWKVSIRRACAALEFDRSTFHYRSRKRDQAGIEARIKAICETRVRYGYRRVHVMLQREGWDINIKRTYRIYNEMGLQLRNKTPKRRVKAKLRDDRRRRRGRTTSGLWTSSTTIGHRQDDPRADSRRYLLPFSPVIDPRFSYRAEDVVATLERVCAQTGYPKTIRVDQGSEFVSRDLDLWAYAKGVTLDFSRPANRRITHSSKRSTGLPERVSERPLVPDACRRPRKDGGLAHLLQRGPPARAIGNKPPSRCRNPAAHSASCRKIGRKLQPPRSNKWDRSVRPDLTYDRRKTGHFNRRLLR